jgi:integrase
VQVRDHRYWLPILALHTGCRLEELGQLHRTDLKSQDGIWYLDITTTTEAEEGPAKRLKTRSSQRIVPLHPAVIRLGFVSHVQGLEGPSRRIFSCLEPTPDGRLTQSYSKVFSRYCNQIGLRDRRKVFHSFRHLFKDRCRDARIPEDVHDALTGHSSGGEGRRYGAGVPLGVLHGAVSELVFEGFPL